MRWRIRPRVSTRTAWRRKKADGAKRKENKELLMTAYGTTAVGAGRNKATLGFQKRVFRERKERV